METELEGYVIYSKDRDKEPPLGIVSDNYDCKAVTNYIPTRLKQILVEIEDKRFYSHNGIDFKGVSRAILKNIKAGRIVQGGSTISQQLARNIMHESQKTITRKLKETIKAVNIERHYSKDEILNSYFNNIYFGKNIWGLRTASIYYFGKEVEKLNQPELLYLLTILRGPNYYIKRYDITKKRYANINNILYERKIISKSRLRKNINSKITLQENDLLTFKNVSIPYIANHIDNKRKIIISSIELKTQDFINKFVAESKYPVSIISLKKGKITGFASSYGTDYPFILKTNVGSTLKPFLYCFLREKGITEFDKFDAYKNDLNWAVREVKYYNSKLNLQEALLYSNNNSFINAAKEIGIENCLEFLSNTLNKPLTDLYPASILGATKNGISLYELALTYSNFFNDTNSNNIKKECLAILNRVFCQKLGFEIKNVFLKTGTTNDNKERYAILGNQEQVYAIMRNENISNDNSKEGSFLMSISKHIASFFNNKSKPKRKNDYKWI